MLAGAEYNCTAQLLRSIRALHILHRNAQRHQVTRHDPLIDDLTYFRVVVVVEPGWAVVVVVGVVNWRFSFTGPIGWATR
jgi:hypothetical protein